MVSARLRDVLEGTRLSTVCKLDPIKMTGLFFFTGAPIWPVDAVKSVDAVGVTYQLPTYPSFEEGKSFFQLQLLVGGRWLDLGSSGQQGIEQTSQLGGPSGPYSLRVRYHGDSEDCIVSMWSEPLRFDYPGTSTSGERIPYLSMGKCSNQCASCGIFVMDN